MDTNLVILEEIYYAHYLCKVDEKLEPAYFHLL